MNRMKKLLALLLVLALGLSLAACGGAKSDIVGTWRGKVDMTEYIISKGDADIGAVLSDQGVDMPLDSIGNYLTEFAPVCTYVFREDGTYTFTMDEASMQLVLEAYQAGVEAYFRYFYAQVLCQTLVELGMAEQVNGVEELEAILGVSLDEVIAEMLGMELHPFVSLLLEETIGGAEAYASRFNSEGKYKAKDGKLWLSAGLEYHVDPERCDYYNIAGNILTIEEGSPSEGEVSAMVYPLVFEKIA